MSQQFTGTFKEFIANEVKGYIKSMDVSATSDDIEEAIKEIYERSYTAICAEIDNYFTT